MLLFHRLSCFMSLTRSEMGLVYCRFSDERHPSRVHTGEWAYFVTLIFLCCSPCLRSLLFVLFFSCGFVFFLSSFCFCFVILFFLVFAFAWVVFVFVFFCFRLSSRLPPVFFFSVFFCRCLCCASSLLCFCFCLCFAGLGTWCFSALLDLFFLTIGVRATVMWSYRSL